MSSSNFLTPLREGSAQDFRLLNARTGLTLADRLETAFDSASRRTGLLNHTSLPAGSAMIIAPCSAIHTFFMKFSIDVAFVAKDGRVVKTCTALGPFQLAGALRAYAVVELPAGALRLAAIVCDDYLEVVAADALIRDASSPPEAAE